LFVASLDPFEAVAGRGVQQLRQAGIEVEVGMLAGQARRLNESFLKRLSTGLPWVIAKWAQTLDGRIASASGQSRWISGPASRRSVHRLRARVDTVVVGIGTALADDPMLTARGVLMKRWARRVVVDPALRLPLESQLVQSLRHPAAPPLTLAVAESLRRAEPRKLRELQGRGVSVVGLSPAVEPDLATSKPRLRLKDLLMELGQARGATNVLVEGGAGLIGSLLEQGLIDQARVYLAPKLLGQDRALPAVSGLPGRTMAHARRLRLRSHRCVGRDLVLDYRIFPRIGHQDDAEATRPR
jgi:diaminohydroxyphosphoribosylaminopyrimidine deaminase/5-amino-6-(5-phosphoribosylamino)uracil reductase